MSHWLKSALLYGIAVIAAISATSYVGDYAVLRYRIAKSQSPFGQVAVTTYYAMHLKTGKVEYEFQPPHLESCSNSLYPQMGLRPCWYLNRHREQRIDI